MRLDLLSIPQLGYCGCSKIFRQNIPHEVYAHIGCALLYILFEDLCMVPTILQNKMMRAIASFIGRSTLYSVIR